jgi:hypothetical protein
MRNKLLALLAITIITLLTSSYTYACLYTDASTINCQDFNIIFTTATTSDNENTKNTANIQAQIAYDHQTINVRITNAYPQYEAYLKYTIKNTGKYPAQFTAPTITNPNPEALQITTTNHQNTILQPGQTIQGTTTIHLLATIQQNRQYTFQIKNTATAKEPTHPHTASFWTDQFQAHTTCKSSQATVDPTTLEQYLNQINAQSNIFKFTGTRNQKFQQALNILNPSGYVNTETKLKTQLLALWLNQIADWTENYTVDHKTAQQIIQGSETALLNHQTNKYATWKNLCELFNNLT